MSHHLQTLANEREKATREHASLKSDLKAKCQQHAMDLEADHLIGKQAKRCTQCPSPLTAGKLKRKKTISEVASQATSLISELMDMDSNAQMSEAGEDNSPTPIADVPLAPLTTNVILQTQSSTTPAPMSPHTKLLNMMAKDFQQMGDLIDSKLAKALALINKCLNEIKNGPNAWDPKFGFDDHNILNDPTYDPNFREEDITSKQCTTLANQQATQHFTMEWDNAQNH
jgi:hypothetical protein